MVRNRQIIFGENRWRKRHRTCQNQILKHKILGFTLIELLIVLTILGILISLSLGLWKNLADFYFFWKKKKLFEKTQTLFLEHSNNPFELLNFYKKLSSSYKKKRILVISQAFLRFFPEVCNFFPDFPFLDRYVLKIKFKKGSHKNSKYYKTNVAYFYAEPGKNGKFDFEFKENEIILSPSSDDLIFAPTFEELKRNLACEGHPPVLSSPFSNFQKIIKNQNALFISPFFPSGFTLKIVTPDAIQELESIDEPVEIPLKDGITQISFILEKNGIDLIKKNEYIGKVPAELLSEFSENPDQSFKVFFLNGTPVKEEDILKAPITIKFSWALNNSFSDYSLTDYKGDYQCLVDFGDGEYSYFPNCGEIVKNFPYLYHTYTFKNKNSFQIQVLIQKGNRFYYFTRRLKIWRGNERPQILTDFNVKKKFKKAQKTLYFFIKFNIIDNDLCECKLYLNGRKYIENRNCRNLFLSLKERDKAKWEILELFVRDEKKATNFLKLLMKEDRLWLMEGDQGLENF